MFIPLHDRNPLDHITRQYVTLAIIAVNCLIWLVMGTPAFMGQEAVRATVYSYGFIPAVVNGYEVLPAELALLPEEFTYVSYAFFHGDFMHLAGNMLFIWVFGDNVEDAMGHLRFILFYLACVVAGALAHSVVAPQSAVPLIGASAAAAGIVVAYLVLHPKLRIWVLALGKIPLRIPAFFVLGAWIAFQIFQFLTAGDSEVSWASHIGGIIAGVLLILILRRPGVRLFDRDDNIVLAQASGEESVMPDKREISSAAPKTSVTQTRKPRKHQWGRGGNRDA